MKFFGILTTFGCFFITVYARDVIFHVEKLDQCETPTAITVDVKVANNQTANKIYYSVNLNVHEEVKGPVEMMLVVNKCDLKKKHCGHFQDLQITGICQKLSDPYSLYNKAFAEMKPPLKCPLKVGIYSMMDSLIDLSGLTGLSIDGHIWVVQIKWMSGDKNILCIDNETKITKIMADKMN
ncbi:unnamed protein product [Diamesa hyperborea]